MTTLELSQMTVIELRKLAKENKVTLGAGISKADIIAKLADALGEAEPEAAPQPIAEPVQAPAAASAPAAPAKPAAGAQPQFRAAWHNPSAAPKYNAKPAYQAPAYGNRPAWQNPNAPRQTLNPEPQQRPAPVRPAGFTPRFGPGAAPAAPAPEQPAQDEFRTYRSGEPVRQAFGQQPAYGQSERPAPVYGEVPAPAPQQPAYGNYESRAPYAQRQPAYGGAPARRDPNFYNQDLPVPPPAVGEILAAGDCQDGDGILELHPDGYGFLRSEHFLPSSKDIYISMAQIRRFGLRTGDHVIGKTRPQRDGDKYTAMLYITEVNGCEPDEMTVRPIFDELTPVYPSRRIDLEPHDSEPLSDVRLVDLIAPLGFGQRGLLLCPPNTGKTALLQGLANVIYENHPDAEVMVLLIDELPEDVTEFREHVSCRVLASTFDQAPENHLRLVDMVLERAQRLAEQGKDVVILADSLTQLAKIYTSSAIAQGRSTPGMVNPSSLLRAKKLFGAARCLKEGGTLTVIGTMNIDTGSRVDDSVVEEFKGTANMELWLDAALAQAGVSPAISLQRSGTKRADALLNPAQQEGLHIIRSMLSTIDPASAVTQLLSMMEKAPSNDELLLKIKGWAELMKKSK